MRLTFLRYRQHEGTPNEWGLECEFDRINLIVGKNASGKTRTLNVISNLTKQIARSKEITFSSGDYELHFKNKGKSLRYYLKYENKEIVEEKLFISGKIFLRRGANGIGKIFSKEVDKNLGLAVDKNQIALATKRDAFQHPFLEDIYDWANQLIHFSFGSQLGKDKITLFVKNDKIKSVVDIKDTEKVVSILKYGLEQFGSDFSDSIIKDMEAIGYYLDDINIGQPTSLQIETTIQTSPSCLIAKEKDLPMETDQIGMSQGMFRALSLLIQINYHEFTNNFGTVLVDDIGEGLDYERSSSLVQLLTNKAKNNKFQLIMTSNDRFTMNNVPLEYWSIIHREGVNIEYFNKKSSKDIFRKFELTGLDNFDMFSSEYFLKNKDDKDSDIR